MTPPKSKSHLKDLQYATLILSIALFTISLLLPAFHTGDGDWGDKGISALAAGAIAFLGGGLAETGVWLANPLYFLAILLAFMGKRKAIYPSILACALSLSFTGWSNILTSENGYHAPILSLGSGYVLWAGSILVLAIGLGLSEFKKMRGDDELSPFS